MSCGIFWTDIPGCCIMYVAGCGTFRSSTQNSCTLVFFVFGLYFDFLQNKHLSSAIAMMFDGTFGKFAFSWSLQNRLWFRITAARYKVVQEEICMHWAGFEPEQPHIMHSSAIDHGAKETHLPRLTRIQWVFYPRVREVGNKQKFLRGEEGLI